MLLLKFSWIWLNLFQDLRKSRGSDLAGKVDSRPCFGSRIGDFLVFLKRPCKDGKEEKILELSMPKQQEIEKSLHDIIRQLERTTMRFAKLVTELRGIEDDLDKQKASPSQRRAVKRR
jgi:hypothetical protein